MAITAAELRVLSSSATNRVVSGIVDNQNYITQGNIDTPLRLCHFMAQLAHESAHLTVTREFASGAAYEGRIDLGNTHPGDGRRYRGRGLIQTTGRANYRDATTDIRRIVAGAPDFESDPVSLEDFPWALLCSVTYWQRHNINRFADRDDLEDVTRAINPALLGLSVRRDYLRKAKAIWLHGLAAGGGGGHPTLRRGDRGDAVVELQRELSAAGFRVQTDGDFGPHTEEAVDAFQRRHGLVPDGVVGPLTWAALRADR